MQTIHHLSALQRESAHSQLKASALFGALSAASIDAVIQRITLTTLSEGDVLFHQQAPASHVFLLSFGQVKLSRSASNGTEKIISLVSPGHTFAEAVMFSKRKQYPVSAVAVKNSSVWSIDADHYAKLLHQSTDACFAMMARVTERLHEQVADIERLTLHTATSRLIAYLLAKVDHPGAGQTVVKLDAPKNVIASRLSIVPATFSRSLSRLSRDNLLEVHDNQIVLLNVAALMEYTDQIEV